MDAAELQRVQSQCAEALSGVQRVRVLAGDLDYFVKVIEAAQAGAEFSQRHGDTLKALQAEREQAQAATAEANADRAQAEALTAETIQRLAQETAEATQAAEQTLQGLAAAQAQAETDLRGLRHEIDALKRLKAEEQRQYEHQKAAHEAERQGWADEAAKAREDIQILTEAKAALQKEVRLAQAMRDEQDSSPIYRRQSHPRGR
jgi:chromosome segregation ATPase